MKTAPRSPARAPRYEYEYPHPAVTVDGVVLGLAGQELQVLLIQRAHAPHAGRWAFPGGFVEMDEGLEDAAGRELTEETGLRLPAGGWLQLGAYGDPRRDPRERVITVVFMHLSGRPDQPLAAGSDARQARWFPVRQPPPLAFDHRQILAAARQRLRELARLGLRPLALLPPEFSLAQAQALAELLSGGPFDKRNFRRRFLGSGLLAPTGRLDRSGRRRPARLHRLARDRWRALDQAGFALVP